jgi:pimeloyl-ACP methyl ester carboxylesterase
VTLVHGSNVDCRIWEDHCRLLGERYQVIAPTQRHFGIEPATASGTSFSVESHAEDLARFIAALELAPATVVGWSYGAAVCLTACARHPELIARLFLYEPALATFVADASDAQSANDDRMRMTAAARAKARSGDLMAAVELFMDGVNDDPGTFRRLPDRVQAVMRENAQMLPLLFAAPAPDLGCDDLRRVAIPVTVALGRESRPFYRIASEWAARCIPGAGLLRIPQARHLWPIQDPPAFSVLVDSFLRASR